ncbi:MAG: hypothetical protein KAU21_02460, partial [Gammaproteobacteria bacterium]|nr:hypothetical protein [Gammaproteobacteria bacterium]
MLDYLYRLVTGFEREHGMRPNLLYINPEHCKNLKSSFDERYSMGDIMGMLKMEVIVDVNSTHPHVCWTHAA